MSKASSDLVAFETSGSSGAAKPIVRTESSLQEDAAALVREFPSVWGDPSVTVVSSVRPEHMYGALWRVRAPRKANLPVDPALVLSVEQLLDLARRYGRLLFVTTPSFLEKAVAHPDFPRLKGHLASVVTSGSLLRTETAAAVQALVGISPLEIFGCTEAGTVASRRQSEGPLWKVYSPVNVEPCPGGLSVDSPFALSRPYVMSDAIEPEDARHFRLLGRTDRRVKILESYVSLPDVEVAFESHPFVARAHAVVYGADIPRIGLLIVPAPAAFDPPPPTLAAFNSRLRADLRAKIPPAAFPRRIRLVRQLPANEQGKVTAAAARKALDLWAREPFVTDWSCVAGTLAATLVFPADLPCFQGHFPGMPVLPGVAQLYYLRHFARQAFLDFPDAATYRRLKFQKIIRPGTPVALRVVRTDNAFDCSLAGPNGLCSSCLVAGGTP